jgi:hypothetical protein
MITVISRHGVSHEQPPAIAHAAMFAMPPARAIAQNQHRSAGLQTECAVRAVCVDMGASLLAMPNRPQLLKKKDDR